jgi:DNA-binding CsgD family transcriptional regulator
VIALFFRVHYQMGLVRLVDRLTFPDLSFIASMIVLVALFALSYFIDLPRHNRTLGVFGWVSGLVCTLAIELPALFSVSAGVFGTLGAIALALYLIPFWLLWFRVFKTRSLTVVVTTILISTAIGCFLAWFFLELTGFRLLFGLLLLLLLSGTTLLYGINRLPMGEVAMEGVVDDGDKTGRIPIILLIVTFCFSLAYMYVNTRVGLETFHSTFSLGMVFYALILLLAVMLLSKWLTLGTFFSLAAPILITGMMLSLFTEIDTSITLSLFDFGFYTYLVFAAVLHFRLAENRGYHASRAACLLIAACFLGCFIGRFLPGSIDTLAGQAAGQVHTVVSVLIITFLVICTMFCLVNTYRLFGALFTNPLKEILDTGDGERLGCEQAATVFDLSERELEVLRLLVRGMSATQIADELVIAHGTAKAHIRNIYKKADIHRREDLFALLGE